MGRTRYETEIIDGQLEQQSGRDGKRKRYGRERTRWRDEIGSFVGVTWNRQASDRDEWRRLGKDFGLQ